MKKKTVKKIFLQHLRSAREMVKEYTDRVEGLIYDSNTLEKFEGLSGLWLDQMKCKDHLELIWKENDLLDELLIKITRELELLYEQIRSLSEGPPNHSEGKYLIDDLRRDILFRVNESIKIIDSVFEKLGYRKVKNSAEATSQHSDKTIEKIIWNASSSDLAEIMFYLWKEGLICPQERTPNGMFEVVGQHFVTKEIESDQNLRQLLVKRQEIGGKPLWEFKKRQSPNNL
jgi:hypothetical protein